MFLASSSVPLHCLARGFSSHVLRTCRLESDIRDSKEIVPIGEQEQQCAGPPDRKVWGPVPCSSTQSYTSRHDYRRTANMLMQGRVSEEGGVARGRWTTIPSEAPDDAKYGNRAPDWLPCTSLSRQHPTFGSRKIP